MFQLPPQPGNPSSDVGEIPVEAEASWQRRLCQQSDFNGRGATAEAWPRLLNEVD